MQIDFQKCREKFAGSLNEFCNRWCKREHVECDALKDWKLNRVGVKCVTRTRTRVGKPVLGFYKSLKIYIAANQTR